jgi:hypothetical protein
MQLKGQICKAGSTGAEPHYKTSPLPAFEMREQCGTV